jgi:hypothetical protein
VGLRGILRDVEYVILEVRPDALEGTWLGDFGIKSVYVRIERFERFGAGAGV